MSVCYSVMQCLPLRAGDVTHSFQLCLRGAKHIREVACPCAAITWHSIYTPHRELRSADTVSVLKLTQPITSITHTRLSLLRPRTALHEHTTPAAWLKQPLYQSHCTCCVSVFVTCAAALSHLHAHSLKSVMHFSAIHTHALNLRAA